MIFRAEVFAITLEPTVTALVLATNPPAPVVIDELPIMLDPMVKL